MMQTNSFSEQIYKQNQISTLSTAKNLLLASAITATIIGVPGLGWFLGLMLQIPMVVTLVLGIITIVFAKKAKQSMIGSILLIIASPLSFSTFLILLYMSNLPYYSAAHDSASVLYTIVGLPTWMIYVAAAIVLFIEFNAANKALIELKFHNAALFQTPYISPQPTPTPQAPHPTPVQPATPFTPPLQSAEQFQHTQAATPSAPQQANPFVNQPEIAQTPNPFITQEVAQPTSISELPQQVIQTTNPFLAETQESQDSKLFADQK